MTALAMPTKLVQKTFGWDDNAPWEEPATKVAPRRRSSQRTSNPGRVASPPREIARPTVQQTSCVRRGRCEHVGGMMATVLARYGIDAEEFRQTVEQLRAQRNAAAQRS